MRFFWKRIHESRRVSAAEALMREGQSLGEGLRDEGHSPTGKGGTPPWAVQYPVGSVPETNTSSCC